MNGAATMAASPIAVLPLPVAHAAGFARIHREAMPRAAWSEAAFAALGAQPGVFAAVVEGYRLEEGYRLQVTGYSEKTASAATCNLQPVTSNLPPGFLLARVAADECEILTLAVLPETRRRGIAARLLERALCEARRQGATACFLEVAADNAPALALYRRAGFAECGRRKAYYGGTTDALLMRLSLNAAF
jgi:ribosomal-protein-alanine N-acetyltransferase